MKKTLFISFLAITAISGTTGAAVIFSDNFSTFSLGTTWYASDATLNAIGGAPNINLASNGIHLNMQSNGGYGDSFAIYTTVPTPISDFGDLTITVSITPLLGWLTPIEVDIGDQVHNSRFFTWVSQMWYSDGPAVGRDIGGHWDLNQTYIATYNITDSGSTLSIKDGNTVVYSRDCNLTRDNIGDNLTLQFRQLTQGDGTNTSANIDYITLSGDTIPETSTLFLCSVAIVGLLRRRRAQNVIINQTN